MSAAEAKGLYDEIAGEVTDGHEVVASQMFGMPVLKAGNGKAFAGLYREGMTFKLPPEDFEAAMRTAGIGQFEPGGMGRPMGGWVLASLEAREQWRPLARKALQFVAALPRGKK